MCTCLRHASPCVLPNRSTPTAQNRAALLACRNFWPLWFVSVMHIELCVFLLAGVRAVCWTPDGEMLASGGDEGVVHVCDVPTGAVKFSLQGHGTKIWCIACSNDGFVLVSASKDHTVRLWSTADGKQLQVLQENSGSTAEGSSLRTLAKASNVNLFSQLPRTTS